MTSVFFFFRFFSYLDFHFTRILLISLILNFREAYCNNGYLLTSIKHPEHPERISQHESADLHQIILDNTK